jgi:hypothetical protein
MFDLSGYGWMGGGEERREPERPPSAGPVRAWSRSPRGEEEPTHEQEKKGKKREKRKKRKGIIVIDSFVSSCES